ncbi:hypothetical protein Efla_001832 [Eimeria flavescens]
MLWQRLLPLALWLQQGLLQGPLAAAVARHAAPGCAFAAVSPQKSPSTAWAHSCPYTSGDWRPSLLAEGFNSGGLKQQGLSRHAAVRREAAAYVEGLARLQAPGRRASSRHPPHHSEGPPPVPRTPSLPSRGLRPRPFAGRRGPRDEATIASTQRLLHWVPRQAAPTRRDSRDAADVPHALRATMNALGFYKMIGPQAEALALAAAGSDVALSSPTATGKTLCMLLPLLQWHAARLAAAQRADRGALADTGHAVSQQQQQQQQLRLAASAASPAAVGAVAKAEAVSLVLAPTQPLALQLLHNLTCAVTAWLEAAGHSQQQTQRGLAMPQGPLPRLLLLTEQAAGEAAAGSSLPAPTSRQASLPLSRLTLADPKGLILVATPQALRSLAKRLAASTPGSLRHLAASVRHLALDEADRLFALLRRHAPLKARMQSLNKPQALQLLMHLLVLSRSSKLPSAGGGPAAGRQQPEASPLPLQLLAASASLGRPLHRRLTAFVRWKEQLLQRASDPPLHAGIMGGTDRRRLQELVRKKAARAVLSPQQRMRVAFERLASRGLLGLPRLPQQAAQEATEERLSSSASHVPFKTLLPLLRRGLMLQLAGEASCPYTATPPAKSSKSTSAAADTSLQAAALGGSGAWRASLIPSSIHHQLFVVSDNSAESLAAAATEICEALRPRRALLLLQQGSSLRSLQQLMLARGRQVTLGSRRSVATRWLSAAASETARDRLRLLRLSAAAAREQLLAAEMDSARGVHVEGAELVLLLGRVRSAREYQHLAGRVGRCGRRGLCVTVSDAASQRVVLSWRRTLGIEFASMAAEGPSVQPLLPLRPASPERKAVDRDTPDRRGPPGDPATKPPQSQVEMVGGSPAWEDALVLQRAQPQEETEGQQAAAEEAAVALPSLLLMQRA